MRIPFVIVKLDAVVSPRKSNKKIEDAAYNEGNEQMVDMPDGNIVIAGSSEELKRIQDALSVAILSGASKVELEQGALSCSSAEQIIIFFRNTDDEFECIEPLLGEEPHFEIIGGYSGLVIGCCPEGGVLDVVEEEPGARFVRVRKSECRSCSKETE